MSTTKVSWAAKHANALLGIGGAIGIGLMAWLFSTVNSIENQLIRMNTEQAPLYGEMLHTKDEMERLRIRVLAQEQAMRILGYPVPELITDDAAQERSRSAELERQLKDAEEEANKPFWKDILGGGEKTIDQSSEVEMPAQEAIPVTLPTKEVDDDRIKRYMEQVQSKK